MKKTLLINALAILALANQAYAGTMFGALSNFDAVNDTGSPCNGFEIELDDIQSKDVTYTFQYQRYGTPKITEDTFLVSGVPHPRTFVRWMSPYDQVLHVFTQTTPVAPAGFKDTGGHLCFKNMTVAGQPYDTAGCEHFGVGTLKNPSNTVYRWMKEDPATPGSLLAQGSPVTIPAPVWTVNPVLNAPPVVVAVIPVPPPPAVVPVPYLPNAEFGVAVWAKVFETESPSPADLHHLVADDEAVPGNHGAVPNANAVTEIAWQILQTDSMNPTVNELASSRQMGAGNESVTRRYEFYMYTGPYSINSSDGPGTGTNEAVCTSVAADDVHGVGVNTGYYNTDCSAAAVVGDYIGAQNAAADVATPLSANGAVLADGEVGVRYPDRPLIFGGSGGPYSIGFSGAGTLPAADAGNEFNLDSLTGVLQGGIPNGTGTATFTVQATDLVEPSQPAVTATFNITVVDAVTVDSIVIPNGTPNVLKTVNLTASGGETPFKWSVVPATPGLQASVIGNTLSLKTSATGAFNVQVSVSDSLGGVNTKTLTYNVAAPGLCADVVCAALDSCHDVGVCDPASGVCSNPAKPDGAACNDTIFCNGTDTCSAGACSLHAGNPCAAGGECANVCNEAGATCNLPAATACSSDGNVCTDDVCDGAGTCSHTANSAPCDDGSFCDGADTCAGGTCSAHSGDPCATGGECANVCNEAGATCNVAAATPCSNDGNACTDDVCNGSGTCTHTNNTAPCSDSDPCTVGDVCSAGACVAGSSKLDCSDIDPCTQDSCKVGVGCEHAQEPADPASCALALSAKLQISDAAGTAQDKLAWQWTKGEAFDQAALGTPDLDTAYTLCVYDTAAGASSLAASIAIAPSSKLWSSIAPKGWNYTDKTGTSDGVTRLQLRTGNAGRTKILLTAGTSNLALPGAAGSTYFYDDPSVVVQLLSSAGRCWTSSFATAEASANTPTSFKARVK